jgi:hypothetical protein
MTKESLKRKKAVKKLDKAVRKAVNKGLSQAVVAYTVEAAIGKDRSKAPAGKAATTMDDDPATEAVTPRAAKLPGRNKPTDVTFKRGITAPQAKAALNMKPMVPDSEKPSLKKLPDKRKPATPTSKRGKNS